MPNFNMFGKLIQQRVLEIFQFITKTELISWKVSFSSQAVRAKFSRFFVGWIDLQKKIQLLFSKQYLLWIFKLPYVHSKTELICEKPLVFQASRSGYETLKFFKLFWKIGVQQKVSFSKQTFQAIKPCFISSNLVDWLRSQKN